MTLKFIPVNYKALSHIEKVNERQTKCYFRNQDTGEEFSMILAVTIKQIVSWYYGLNINEAMPELSKDLKKLFYNGSVDLETKKLLATN